MPRTDNNDRPPIQAVCDVFIGADPGAAGGLAAIVVYPAGATYGGGGRRVETISAKTTTPHDLWMWLSAFPIQDTPHVRRCHAALEKVGGFIARDEGKNAGGAQPGSAMFNFGRSAGMLEGFLIAAGIPYVTVAPRAWQKPFGLKRAKGEGKTPWKNRLKAAADKLFPLERVTLATADALLMAEFCRRQVANAPR
jgi:hypothetical protein